MRFFTSDHHFGHKNIIRLAERPFTSITEMNEVMVRRWNRVVAPEDEVFHLGDVALGPIYESLDYVKRLNGHKHLIVGNHDRCFAGQKFKASMNQAYWMKVYKDVGFETQQTSLLLPVDMGLDLGLCHFPYEGDSTDPDRWLDYRKWDLGVTLLHGHTHSKTPVTRSPGGTLQINVGVDAWNFTPVSVNQIEALIIKNPPRSNT